MECKKCKNIINEGETFCRKCATSIYVDDIEIISTNKPSNVNTNKIVSIIPKLQNNNSNVEPIKNNNPYEINNKDLIDRGQNDEMKAKLSIWVPIIIALLILLTIIIIVAIAI